METTIINLYGGPGTGKSTNMAAAFAEFKIRGYNAEIVPEYAKDLVWEDRHHALGFQPYLISKQMWRVQKLVGKVPIIVTDSPILLGLIYGEHDYGPAWHEHIIEVYNSWNNLNFFLRRNNDNHPYVSDGRTQKTVEEAEVIDKKIIDMLEDQTIFWDVPILEGQGTAKRIVNQVLSFLENNDAH